MSSLVIAHALAGNTMGSAGDNFVIAEWQDAGGPPWPRLIAPLHVHLRDDEAWYVLEGVLRVRVGDQQVEAAAGAGIFVPRGTPHTYWNAGPGRLRYLLVMTSNVFRMIQEIHAMPDRNRSALQSVFKKHHSELLDG